MTDNIKSHLLIEIARVITLVIVNVPLAINLAYQEFSAA
jgi:hypothetical protein